MLSNPARPQSSFDINPRRQQEIRMRPAADLIYRVALQATTVSRFDAESDQRHILDRVHAIDMTVTTANGLVLTGQEKFLSPQFARFNSLTIEYEQNQHTHEPGDWFKLACQVYFCGYAAHDWQTFQSWILVDWTGVVLATLAGSLHWQQNRNKDGKAKASFRYVNFRDIPAWCVISKGGA